MKILAVSDISLPQFNNAEYLRRECSDVELLISCGDMDPEYLDVIASVLGVPLYYVRGNHDHRYNAERPGGINLHQRVVGYNGLTLAGLEGSIRYNQGDIQYTEFDMTMIISRLLPGLILRRLIKGYSVDLLVAHNPPRHIHDKTDWAHRGFRSFRWLMRLARPRYLLHGHVDRYDQRDPRETRFLKTNVINVNPSMLLTVEKGTPRNGQ